MEGNGLGNTSIKYLLYGINFLFVITGVVLIAQGISHWLYYKNYYYIIEDQYTQVPNALVLVGLSVFVVAAIGWCGVMNENSFVTLMFSTFLLLIFFVELAIGISGYVLKATTHQALSTLNVAETSNSTDKMTSWANLQQDFNCCGVQSADEWVRSYYADPDLPESCCTITKKFGTHITRTIPVDCNLKSPYVHPEGCYKPLERYLKENSLSIELLGFALALFQLVGLAVSCHLASEFRKGYHNI